MAGAAGEVYSVVVVVVSPVPADSQAEHKPIARAAARHMNID